MRPYSLIRRVLSSASNAGTDKPKAFGATSKPERAASINTSTERKTMSPCLLSDLGSPYFIELLSITASYSLPDVRRMTSAVYNQ